MPSLAGIKNLFPWSKCLPQPFNVLSVHFQTLFLNVLSNHERPFIWVYCLYNEKVIYLIYWTILNYVAWNDDHYIAIWGLNQMSQGERLDLKEGCSRVIIWCASHEKGPSSTLRAPQALITCALVQANQDFCCPLTKLMDIVVHHENMPI